MSTFIGEVSKTLGILPIDITIGSKTALSALFMIDSLQITTFCSGGTGLMPTGVCRPLFISSYCFGKVMKWKWCKQISNPSWRLQAPLKPNIMIKNSVLSSSLVEGKMGS